ncbi:MAG: hypothetical protein R2806_25210 [Saprospiraceae bacterium]|nr:hypothetical protein [Lewinella sp.]
MKEILKSVWCLSAILGILSCHNSPPLEDRLEQLAQAFHDLDCRQATLEAETSSSWDDVVAQLDARLPESMPAAEKNNMLMVRNAGLIRMFESYHELPDSVQALVSWVEQKDNEVVASLNEIKAKRSVLDKEKRDFFLAVEKRSAAKLSTMRENFDAIRNTPCQ